MRISSNVRVYAAALSALAPGASVEVATPLCTAITHQGQLKQNGGPVNDTAETRLVRARLYPTWPSLQVCLRGSDCERWTHIRCFGPERRRFRHRRLRPESVIPDPRGSDAAVVGGRLIVDFDNGLDLGTIDSVLTKHRLKRIGIVGSVNLVTAEILDGKTELEAQADVETEDVVQGAPLAYILSSDDFAGETQPPLAVGTYPVGEVPDKLNTAINWHHYVMDTFAAHALAEAVIGEGLSGVELAVVDGGFHSQAGTGAGDTAGSILVDPVDRDLVPKMMPPVYNTSTDVDHPGPTTGVLGVASNPGLFLREKADGAIRTKLHGLMVSSAAAAAGENLLGTGKHVRIRPVQYQT